MVGEVNVLDLFAGNGGASYAGKLIGGWRTVCYVENDQYCHRVLKRRIRDYIFDDAPIWDDATTFDGKPWAGLVDIVTAGFPCQPFSIAGKRKGAADQRNLWPDTCRIISEVGPRFAFLENSSGILSSGYFPTIIGTLTDIGYDARWTVVSAKNVGAHHIRNRVWILAYPFSVGPQGWRTDTGWDQGRKFNIPYQVPKKLAHPDHYKPSESGLADPSIELPGGLQVGEEPELTGPTCSCEDVGNPNLQRCEGGSRERESTGVRPAPETSPRWFWVDPADVEYTYRGGREDHGGPESELEKDWLRWTAGRTIESKGLSQPLLGRVAHGVTDRCNRIRTIGNMWVPAVAAVAWRILTGEFDE